MHKEVDKETVYSIMIGVLGVNGVVVDAVHDIYHRLGGAHMQCRKVHAWGGRG
jgi:hypothetical protein